MMDGPPRLFDRDIVRARLKRAAARAETFLLDRTVGDFGERLDAILRPFPRVLDVGTPTPALAAALFARSGERRIVRAAPLPEAPLPGVETLVCDIEALPFAAAGFDLAVCALALQSVNDLPGTLIQIRRALAPDGLFLACLVGGDSLTELRAVLAQAETEVAGGVSPRVAPFADVRDLGGLLQRAGFALPVADSDTLVVRYPHLFALMADLRAMGATNALAQRLRRPTRRAVFVRAAELYAQRFADADGRICATFELVWLSGWAPHESQQKPLAPGSARMRLADALADQAGARQRKADEPK